MDQGPKAETDIFMIGGDLKIMKIRQAFFPNFGIFAGFFANLTKLLSLFSRYFHNIPYGVDLAFATHARFSSCLSKE